MTAKIVYTGGLRTEATHLRSGSVIETDAPVDNKGKGERFSPTDLVAVALATCMLTTIGIAANAHHFNIDGATCDVEKIMYPDPRRIGEIKTTLNFPDTLPGFTEKEKQIIERTALTCPVYVTLHPDCKKTVSFNWLNG